MVPPLEMTVPHIVTREMNRGYGHAEIAQLFAACPRSFPPPPEGFEKWTARAVAEVTGR